MKKLGEELAHEGVRKKQTAFRLPEKRLSGPDLSTSDHRIGSSAAPADSFSDVLRSAG